MRPASISFSFYGYYVRLVLMSPKKMPDGISAWKCISSFVVSLSVFTFFNYIQNHSAFETWPCFHNVIILRLDPTILVCIFLYHFFILSLFAQLYLLEGKIFMKILPFLMYFCKYVCNVMYLMY